MTQGVLFSPLTIEQRFRKWLAENPGIYDAVVRLAREVKAKGKSRCGMKALFERVRWDLWLDARGDEFRMNNIYSSRLAREVMRREPDLTEFFETRELKRP